MADELMDAPGADLDAIAAHIHSCELQRQLKTTSGALSTNDGKNYATLEYTSRSPRRPIVILPSPAVPPGGATKISDGELTITPGGKIKVTAFRLP